VELETSVSVELVGEGANESGELVRVSSWWCRANGSEKLMGVEI
jgi:hypothetical protein